MKKVILLAALSFSLAAHAAPKVEPFDIVPAKGGNIRITPKFHASLQIEYRGKVIVVDPVSAASWTKKADLILITHPHGDHLDLAAVAKLVKPETDIVAPETIASQIKVIKSAHNVYGARSGSDWLSGRLVKAKYLGVPYTLSAVAMYNIVRGPKLGKKFHPKGEWNGYVLTLGGKRLYFAGDTEATPEMKALKNIDIAFLPMNLPFTMTPQEAAQAVKDFKPRIVYPYHYRYPFDKANNNPQQFAAALKGTKIQVRIRSWYPADAVKKMMAKK